jgi:hypothetical protein
VQPLQGLTSAGRSAVVWRAHLLPPPPLVLRPSHLPAPKRGPMPETIARHRMPSNNATCGRIAPRVRDVVQARATRKLPRALRGATYTGFFGFVCSWSVLWPSTGSTLTR